jgi:hypothetical protein
MSGYTADVIAGSGILEEGVHFIHKPFSIKAFAAQIRAAMGSDGETDFLFDQGSR